MKKTTTHIILAASFAAALLLTSCRKESPAPEAPQHSPNITHKEINKEVSYNEHVGLDLNEDGVYDFYFTTELANVGNKVWTYFAAAPGLQSGSRVVVQHGPDGAPVTDHWAIPMGTGYEVSDATPATSWSGLDQKGFLLATSANGTAISYRGTWPGKLHQYMAVKFPIGGKIHYGWISLTHPGGKERMLIEDAAYNTVAGQPIKTGQR